MTENLTPHLLRPLQIGALALNNRVILAPMSRLRADANAVPTEIVPTYYAQRASAGMIISESVSVSPFGEGFPNIPGIYTDHQQQVWASIVSAVHEKGGKMLAQIMHVGKPRFADPAGPPKDYGWAISEPLHPHELNESDLASVIAGFIVVEAPSGELLHFDILGYVLVCTTAITLTFMYFIDRRIKTERGSAIMRGPLTSAPDPVAVAE